jgi:NAD(P)-dependent dehydrogenase (short-subunit alcohol dehydrogenase family)
LISQALHAHIAQRNSTLGPDVPALTGAVVTLLDQKLWNQTPDFVSYTLSKAALDAANSMLAMALAPLVRVVGVAPRVSLAQPLLQGEPVATVRQRLPSGVTATTLDTSAAVLLALQDTQLSGTTLLVEDVGAADV